MNDTPTVTVDRPSAADRAAFHAEILIDNEFDLQNRMWGKNNERADNTKGQMLKAAVAQLVLIVEKAELTSRIMQASDPQHPIAADEVLRKHERLVREITDGVYPADWSGFRDYGSDIANLVVAGAYIRQEIKRRILLGEDETRAKRAPDQPYNPTTGLPNAVDNA